MNTFKDGEKKPGNDDAGTAGIRQNPGHEEGAIATTPTVQPLQEPQVPRRAGEEVETRDSDGNVVYHQKNPDGTVGSGPNKERPPEEKIEDQPHKPGTRPGERMTDKQIKEEAKRKADQEVEEAKANRGDSKK